MTSYVQNLFEESYKNDLEEVQDYLLEQYKLLISKSNDNPKFREIAENLFLGEIDSFYNMKDYYPKEELGIDLVNRYNNLKFYHYTSFECLESILKSKQLWLSQYSSNRINDSEEMTFYLKAHHASQLSESLDNYFLFCVSCNKDDAPQWERYGDRGRGICIEFTKTALSRLSCVADGYFVPVIYNNQISGYSKASVSGYQNDGEWLADIVARVCLQRKHPSFKNEKEFRLIVPYKEYYKKFKKFENMTINSQGKLELDIKEEITNENIGRFISKVILGPQAEKSKQDVVDLFKKYSCQFDINNVEKSESTLILPLLKKKAEDPTLKD